MRARPYPKTGNGSFSALVAERVAVEREYRRLNSLEAMKLTASAFVAEAVRIAGTSAERLRRLRAALEAPTSFTTTECATTLRRMVAAARMRNFPAPPRELRRLNHLNTPASIAELAVLGSNSFELFALAAQIATEKHPEDFGTCESLPAYERRLLELSLQREELDAQIAAGYSADDVLIGEPDAQGNAHVSFKLSAGAVPLGPKENAGERLCNWVLNQEQRT